MRPSDIIDLEVELFLAKFHVTTGHLWPEVDATTLVEMLSVFSLGYLFPLAVELWDENPGRRDNFPAFLKSQLPSTLNYRELAAA
jgi:hypothetical protein